MSEDQTTDHVYKKSDKEWNEYVLSKLDPSELQDGNPTTDGLRRVAELLLGEIYEQYSEVVQSPEQGNSYNAVVVHTIKFVSGKTFAGSADSNHRNTDKPYDRYPVAVAETRAEGRALRRALGLKKPVADELSQVANEEEDDGTKIKDNQARTIRTLCKRCNIGVNNFINSGKNTYDNLSDVTHVKAAAMIQQLNKYQQKPDSIPEELKGFKDNE